MIQPMMEVITPSFQMLLQRTATKVMKHGTHQDHPGWVTANMCKSSAQADAFPVLILHVVEHRRTIPITGHTESPTTTDYFWILSAVQLYKLLLSHHARRWQALGAHGAAWLACRLQAGAYPALQKCSRTDHRPTAWKEWSGQTAEQHVTCAFVLLAEREHFYGTCTYSHKSSMPVILALSFVFWGREAAWFDTQMLSLN